MTELATEPFRFLGANIKGTPAMPAKAVAEDLELLRRNASVIVTQEFRWPWYWRTARKALQRLRKRDPWRSSPGFAKGLAQPVKAAAAVMWLSSRWKRLDAKTEKLHDGAAGISEDRYLNAALLAEKPTGLAWWVGTCHAVVGGDERTDGPLRQAILEHDLMRLASFVRTLQRTGHPVVIEADLNIHPGTWAYRELMQILTAQGGRLVGVHGVEYLMIFDDDTDVQAEVVRSWEIPTRRLNTDHEVRGATLRLVRRRRVPA